MVGIPSIIFLSLSLSFGGGIPPLMVLNRLRKKETKSMVDFEKKINGIVRWWNSATKIIPIEISDGTLMRMWCNRVQVTFGGGITNLIQILAGNPISSDVRGLGLLELVEWRFLILLDPPLLWSTNIFFDPILVEHMILDEFSSNTIISSCPLPF